MEKVYNYLKKDLKLNDEDIVVVGVSGGPDSMALLFILKELSRKLNFSLVCCHVNHNVREASKDEKIFLEDWCLKNEIVFESMIIEHYGDDNFHNEARNIRYQYFDTIVDKYHANYLMTAHHGDDLIETVLMRLVRGSTLKGYSGFNKIVDMKNYRIVRPLLAVTKNDIEQFNLKNNIPYVIDDSNYKDKYTRNRYRKYILPFLKQENENVHERFLKFSTMLQEYDELIDKQVNKVYSSVFQNGQLLIPVYLDLDKLIQDKVIYHLLEKIYQDDLMLINDKHVQLIQNLILSKKKNSCIYLPNNVKVVKSYDKIMISKESQMVDTYEIELMDYAVLPNGKHLEVISECETNGNDICRLDSKDIELPLYIRTRRLGDKISLKGTDGHKKIKDIFIDSKIPMDEREMWPIVVDAKGEVVWIPGIKKSKFNKTKHEMCDIIIKYY
ncbi:MAG: tRNA lysidine(34) synthetase TilS [Firmicutes bacterium]|nr:tRNA lysidine(34) synthetase TilS [Bacillota bacterium]